MKQSKVKLFALAMALILGSVAILTGSMYALAEIPAEETDYERSDFVDESLFVSDEIPAIEDEPDATDEPAVPVDANNFSAQMSLYNYGTNKVAIVEVENLGEVNSKVTVTGSYLNENGEVIGTESKSFDGFEPELKNRFIFNPGYALADFTYTVAAEVSMKTPYASQIEVYGWYGGWLQDTQGNSHYRPAFHNAWFGQSYDPETGEPDYSTGTVAFTVDIVHANHAKEDIYVTYDWLVLDANGDVFYVGSFVRDMNSETPAGMEDYASRPIYSVTPEEYLSQAALGVCVPAELQENFRIVIALTNVTPCANLSK